MQIKLHKTNYNVNKNKQLQQNIINNYNKNNNKIK